MKQPNFMKYAVVVFLVAGLVALTAPSAKAQTNNATGGVTVTVANALSVIVNPAAENGGRMDWGLLAAPTTGSTVFEFTDNAGTVGVKSGAASGKVLDNNGAVANFEITGQPNVSVSLTITRVDPDINNATLTNFLASPLSPVSLGVTGIVTVDVKADLTLTPAAAGNTFTGGSITLTANY